MSGRQPAYELSLIQAIARSDTTKLRITFKAAETAREILFDTADIVACVLNLQPGDFYKSMPSERRAGVFQDVYKVRFHGFAVYLKLQLTVRDEAVVISFKRDEDA